MSSTNHINLCVQSTGSEDDWKNLYEASFPQDERMSVADVRTLLANGTMLLHKTTDAQGALQCFSLVTVLSNNALLAYIATDQTKRSSGVGSKHMKALIDLLKKAYPTYIGLFLEIESTKEKNLPADEEKARKRRLAFYQRLHCKRMLHREYLLPSYTPGTSARQGELLWSEFNGPVDNDATLKAVISEIYSKAYGLPASDPQFVRVISQFSTPAPAPATTTAPADTTTTNATDTTTTPASGDATVPASQPADNATTGGSDAQTGTPAIPADAPAAPPVVSPAVIPEATPVAAPVTAPVVTPAETQSPATVPASPSKTDGSNDKQ